MSDQAVDRRIAHNAAAGATPPPTSSPPAPAAAAAASSASAPTAPHPSLLSRLSSFLHRVGDFIERHPAATLELGKLLMEVQSMGLHPDELAQLQDIVTVATNAPTSAPAPNEG